MVKHLLSVQKTIDSFPSVEENKKKEKTRKLLALLFSCLFTHAEVNRFYLLFWQTDDKYHLKGLSVLST